MASTLSKSQHRFRGYAGAKKRHECEPDELNSGSSEWQIDPIRQKLFRRGGSSIQGDNLSGGAEQNGILESKVGFRAEQLDSISLPSSSDGYPTYGCLYTYEAGQKGAFYWRSTNSGGINHSLGDEFGSTHYKTTGTAPYTVDMKITPYYAEDGTLGRWISIAQRIKALSGCRQWMEHGKRVYFPGQGTPLMWNKTHNDSAGSGSANMRIFPMGIIPPLSLGYAQLAASSGDGTDNNWRDGDAFYFTVIFEFEDGSLSCPFPARPKGIATISGTTGVAALGTGSAVDLRTGYVNVGTIGGSSTYKNITYTNIPIGQDGVVARWLCRSDIVNLGATTSSLSISPVDMGVIVRIGNNTQTSYIDSNGTSTTGSDRIRFDTIWPPRAQYITGSDGRAVMGGKLQLNPAAIILAPIGINAAGDVNQADTGTIFGGTQCFAQITSSAGVPQNLLLRVAASGGSFPTASVTDTTIALTGGKTIQQVVDEINTATVIGVGTVRWGAALVPGVDPSTLAANLALTDTGVDFGDDGMLTGKGTGNMRCFANSYPGILYFSSSYLASLPTDNYSIIMTVANPTTPGGTANAWVSDKSSNWKAPPHATAGRLMGIAPITGQAGVVCVVFYEHARYVLRNVFGGGTGRDADYRLVQLNGLHGCVNHRTITVGPGVVGCMDDLGYVFCDAVAEKLVSLDVYNPDLARGEWTAEMPKALAGAASGLDQLSYFNAKIIGSTLWVSYRSDNSLAYCDRRMAYRWLEGNESFGLAAVVRGGDGGGQPYGWSAPIKAQKVSAMGAYINGSGRQIMGAIETNAGTVDGRIDLLETGTQDNGTSFTSDCYIGCTPAESYTLIAPKGISLRYTKNATGLSLVLYGDGVTNQGLRSDSYTLTPGSSGSNLFSVIECPLPVAAQSDYGLVEWKISDDGTGSTAPEVYEFTWTAEIRPRSLPT